MATLCVLGVSRISWLMLAFVMKWLHAQTAVLRLARVWLPGTLLLRKRSVSYLLSVNFATKSFLGIPLIVTRNFCVKSGRFKSLLNIFNLFWEETFLNNFITVWPAVASAELVAPGVDLSTRAKNMRMFALILTNQVQRSWKPYCLWITNLNRKKDSMTIFLKCLTMRKSSLMVRH